MFGKLLLNKIELDFVTMQHAAYFLIFLKSLKFLKTKVFLEIQRQYFEILVMKKHWEQSGFMPSRLCFFQHALLSVSVTLCFAKMRTLCNQDCAVLCYSKQTFYSI